jgi:hypothetical protein
VKDDDTGPLAGDYPPLWAWLAKHECAQLMRLDVGKGRQRSAMLKYIAPATSEVFWVELYPNGRGWNVYTADRSNSIASSLTDAAFRLGMYEEQS